MIDIDTFNKLSEVYSKQNLERGLMPFVKNFFLIPANKGYCKPNVNEVLQRMINKKAVTKSDMAVFCFSVFENEVIYKGFLATLPDTIKILIRELLWKESISDEEAALLIKESVTKDNSIHFGVAFRSSSERELKREFYFFTVIDRSMYVFSGGNMFTLSLHPVFKKLLIAYYPKPKEYYFNPLEKIPPTTFCFNAENLIQEEMQRMLSYFMQNGIKYSTRGRPSEPTLNRFQKTAKIQEFFVDEPNLAGKMRSMLIAGLLYNFKITNISIDSLAVLKGLFKMHYTKLHTAQFILMFIKGWGSLDDYSYNQSAETKFLDIVKQLPVDNKWVSVENLMGYIQCRSLLIDVVDEYSISNKLYYEFNNPVHRGYYEKKFLYGKKFLFVNKPFILGSISLFAAFGLIEIAYNSPDFVDFSKTFYSGFDGIEFIRLTPLGAYVLGLSNVYEPPGGLQKNSLKLSEDSLMILVEGDATVFEILLTKFAEKAGAKRFKVSQSHFLKDCSSSNDVVKKILLFKKTIAEKLPVFWEMQFTTWQLNSLKIVEDIGSKLFKIPPHEKDLQRLIAQDEVLKKLILKAEQFYILVQSGNLTKFKARMKELGYVVE